MTGILVCRRSVGFNRHPRVSPAFITRPGPSGLAALQTVRGELRFSKPCQEPATEPLRKLTERLQDAHRGAFEPSPEPSGSTRHLRVSDDRPWAFAGGLSYTAGLSRPPARPAASSDDLRLSIRCVVFATEHLRMLTGTSGFHRVLFGGPTEAGLSILAVSAAIASFRYKGPLVRRALVKLRTVSGATVVTFEATPDFRLSTDAEFYGYPRQPTSASSALSQATFICPLDSG